MDLPWGDEKTVQFITNVGLVTTNGLIGNNIMACEFTHLVSYSPGLIAICIGKGKATAANIQKTKEFGVSLASTEQSVISSVSGSVSGEKTDKIKALEELGFKFYKAKQINTLMVKDSVLNIECKLFKEIQLGSHTMFIGEVISASLNKDKLPLAYHKGKYGKVEFSIPKPTDKEREEVKKILGKNKIIFIFLFYFLLKLRRLIS